MGPRKSKPKPPPVAEIAPEIRMESPTTTNMSSGFHMLEIHGETMSLMVIMLILLGVWAFTTWRAMSWRRKQTAKRQTRLREEMNMELGIIPENTTRTMQIPARTRQIPTLSPLLHQEEQLSMLLPIVSALATQAQAREDINRCQGRITEIPDTSRTGPNRGQQRPKQQRPREWQDNSHSESESLFQSGRPLKATQ